MTKTFNIPAAALAFIFIMITVSCCEKPIPVDPSDRKVFLLYSAGRNSLSGHLQNDMYDLKTGWLPGDKVGDDLLLVYTHTPERVNSYNTRTSPYLIRLYQNSEGMVISDTLVTYPQSTISSSAEQLSKVLQDVRDLYPANSYGMIFSSHASGYLPVGYYKDPSIESKSIGEDKVGNSSYEIDLKEFAEAIPMKLDYILFDACLMGGVEVAYELQGKCSQVGFSQAEVLAEGLNYKTLTKHLLQKEVPDPAGVCNDFFIQYNILSGLEKSATISLVDTDKLEALVPVCASLFEKYRSNISSLDIKKVQGFGGKKAYFFDMIDVVRSAGATEEEIAEMQEATDKAIIYKNHTGQYYSVSSSMAHEIHPDKFCGMSMYIPTCGGTELNKYYRTLKWNQATELLK